MQCGRTGMTAAASTKRWWRWAALAALVLAAGFVALSALPEAAAQTGQAAGEAAQTAGPAAESAADSPAADAPTIAKLFQSSPWINASLLALSVVATIMFVYLVLSLTRSTFNPPRFVDDVTKLIINRQFEQAIHLCQNNSGIFSSSIIQRLAENRDKDPGVLMEILNTEGRRRGEIIWNRIGYLGEIANIAPMLGLLGTVIGMIKVFGSAMSTRLAGEKAALLASGIAEAMSTTMFGLIVAIGAGIFYAIAKSRATVVLAEVEQVCHTVADHTLRSATDPRLKRIDALAKAAREKVVRTGGGSGLARKAAPDED